jgi:hypothetical protein
MKKISTLFKKDPNDLGRVINEVNPDNQWVFDGEGIATRKYDGTAVMIQNGWLHKRYDVKRGRQVPPHAIPCQEPDEITGHWPHWVQVDDNKPEDKYIFEAFCNSIEGDHCDKSYNGTYEAIGEKINGNREKIKGHTLVKHGADVLPITQSQINFESLKEYLCNPENDIEGIVFHHKSDGRMCKLRKSDFGIKR